MSVISIDPITRIEGHLKANILVENGVVTDAWLSGGMYRGIDSILRGRDPRDAPQIAQRVCGVCPVSHAMVSCMALEKLGNARVPRAGLLLRSLMQGANFVQSHILSFFQLAEQDFMQGPDSPPFVPRYPSPDLRLSETENALALDDYLASFEVRRICHEMVALFGGRMPHALGILAGGAAAVPRKEHLIEFAARKKRLAEFVENTYMPLICMIAARYPDLLQCGQGDRTALCMGVFPASDGGLLFRAGAWHGGKDHPFDPSLITEESAFSWFNTETLSVVHPDPDIRYDAVNPRKPNAYSFIKAIRYDGLPMETGPSARMWISNTAISPAGQENLKKHLGLSAAHVRDLGEDFVFSIMGRHILRAEECRRILDAMDDWLKELADSGPSAPVYQPFPLPDSGEAYAFLEAPRGSLLHYIRLSGGLIADYGILPATLWNCSPRDGKGRRGPAEAALIGIPVPDESSPVNPGRLLRSFDP